MATCETCGGNVVTYWEQSPHGGKRLVREHRVGKHVVRWEVVTTVGKVTP